MKWLGPIPGYRMQSDIQDNRFSQDQAYSGYGDLACFGSICQTPKVGKNHIPHLVLCGLS